MKHISYVLEFFIVLITIELLYKPRFDITSNGDLLLWYYNTKRERVYKFICHIY